MEGGQPQVPPTLKQLAPILKHSAQLRGQVPVMSYLCSLYAVQLGLKIKGNDPASKTFLFGLMDRLEQHRAELGSALSQIPDQKAFATNFAVKVFGHADDEYRDGLATRDTAKNFYASTVFFDVLRQFDDPLPEEIENMRKYAKYSAVQITKAIKQGIPVVHPDSELQDTQSDGFAIGGDFDPFSAAAGFPTIPSAGSPSSMMGQNVQSPPPHYGGGGGSPAPTQHHQAGQPYGSPSVTQPTPFDAYSGGGFDIPSVSHSFDHPASRRDLASPPSSAASSAAPHFPAMSPPPAHAFPPAFDAGGSNPYAPAPTSGSPQPPHDAAPAADDSIEQLLSLFPMRQRRRTDSEDQPVPRAAVEAAAAAVAHGVVAVRLSLPTTRPLGHATFCTAGGGASFASVAWPRPSGASPGTSPSTGSACPGPGPYPSTGAHLCPSAQHRLSTSRIHAFRRGLGESAKGLLSLRAMCRFEDTPYAVQNLQLALSLLTGKQYN
ncbi:uncharacterized protein ACA1_228930 [Acanthamoeba castellanii str. Neff]|uniref:Vta1/callose synthase N-terminal domain-containing protein n=1 Tax=Acanthamoeba castellanii (strain ATCC 30010 / Neff) TaxID=1257118 RepID=L8H8T2_ACACF|nr:uncharacterized protein ACA1_228930 [Acanthamoeba castellanii str. Neff]ELR21612.1 hypothetical protein ACA1_228930 [Acanthamoeba castellanii str. Neff]